MIEAGSKVNWTALESGLVDRVFFYCGPKILGGLEALPLAGGFGEAPMTITVDIRPEVQAELARQAIIDTSNSGSSPRDCFRSSPRRNPP
jgi:riboflavin biosynthesis pyrimidine reductase